MTRGDPISPLRWTTKSTLNLAQALTSYGHEVGASTVARLLKDHGYSLQVNAKKLEGRQHRDPRRAVPLPQRPRHPLPGRRAAGDLGRLEEKENIGAYSNGGAEYAPRGEPERTNTYDFIGAAGKAVPYGVYDVGANTGWVNVAPIPTQARSRSSPSAAGGPTSATKPTRRYKSC